MEVQQQNSDIGYQITEEHKTSGSNVIYTEDQELFMQSQEVLKHILKSANDQEQISEDEDEEEYVLKLQKEDQYIMKTGQFQNRQSQEEDGSE